MTAAGTGEAVPGRTAYTPCDFQGCTRSPARDKIPLFRVNPTGETGIFMCAAHAAEVDALPREPSRIAGPAASPPDTP